MSHDCATVNQYHNAILQFNGVLSLFTTGSNTNALTINTLAAGVFGGVGVYFLGLCIVACLIVVIDNWPGKRGTRRGWCMCMFCTCNCRSYYFVMWACWIHAQASLVTAGNLKVNVTAT